MSDDKGKNPTTEQMVAALATIVHELCEALGYEYEVKYRSKDVPGDTVLFRKKEE